MARTLIFSIIATLIISGCDSGADHPGDSKVANNDNLQALIQDQRLSVNQCIKSALAAGDFIEILKSETDQINSSYEPYLKSDEERGDVAALRLRMMQQSEEIKNASNDLRISTVGNMREVANKCPSALSVIESLSKNPKSQSAQLNECGEGLAGMVQISKNFQRHQTYQNVTWPEIATKVRSCSNTLDIAVARIGTSLHPSSKNAVQEIANTLPRNKRNVPEAMQGRWAEDIADCEMGDAVTFLTVKPRELQFYETAVMVESVLEQGGDRVEVNSVAKGEGELWTDKMIIELKDKGNTLVIDGTKRHRCTKPTAKIGA